MMNWINPGHHDDHFDWKPRSSTASNTMITDQDNSVNEKREGPRKKKDKEKTKRMLARLRKPVRPKMMMTMFMFCTMLMAIARKTLSEFENPTRWAGKTSGEWRVTIKQITCFLTSPSDQFYALFLCCPKTICLSTPQWTNNKTSATIYYYYLFTMASVL